jgi:penicillin-binding protein 2
MQYSGSTFQCLGYHGGINISKALQVSCNIFFYNVGLNVGIDTLNKYSQQLGLGTNTGIELPESTGILAGRQDTVTVNQSKGQWFPGDTMQAAIGQSDNQATPLQLCSYMATLMNGGDRYPSHLLSRVCRFGDTENPTFLYEQTEETRLASIGIPKDVLDTVKEGMLEMVESNAIVSRWMTSLPVKVGGKTGSAQNSTGCENALFVCAAPYDEPELVIAVVIEQGYQGSYAALTAARILECYCERSAAANG